MARANRNFRQQDDAVSDVIGTILMVAITVGMMVGLAALLLGTDPPDASRNADLVFVVKTGEDGWGTGDESVRLIHRGGEALKTSQTRIAISVDNIVTTYEGAALDQDFADGTFSIGDTWSKTLSIDLSTPVEAIIVDEKMNQAITQLQISTPSTQPSTVAQYTYVASFTATTGTVSSFSNMQAAGDGQSATLTEATGTGGGSSTVILSASAVDSSTSVTTPTNALQSNNQRAQFDDAGDTITVSGFTAPSDVSAITAVRIGIEAQRSGSGGGTPQATISYAISGTPGATSQQLSVGSSGDATQKVDVSADQTFTVANINNMAVTLVRDSSTSGVKDLDLDHLFVEITYTQGVPEDLNVDLQWAAVPSGTQNTVQLRYNVVNDTFRIQVFDGLVYNTRGSITSSAVTTFSYTLSLSEYNGGSPKIRITDLDSSSDKGSIIIDYARISTL